MNMNYQHLFGFLNCMLGVIFCHRMVCWLLLLFKIFSVIPSECQFESRFVRPGLGSKLFAKVASRWQ